MPTFRKMHDDEVPTDVALVRRLLAAQFPHWAALRIEPVPSPGTSTALYRRGSSAVGRLPRIAWAVGQVDKEHRWLPKLAPLLPLAIPSPLARGSPGEGYPWHWSVYRWLEGKDATVARVADPLQAATELAQFITALQRIDPIDGPPPGPHNFFRGVPLAARDEPTRAAIAALHRDVDTRAVTAAWEASLRAPAWDGAPVWIHGDLQPGNLLVADGRLTAVIDFGGLGVGDPACDLMAAWSFFSADAREVFRANLRVDDATWSRGRGWALSVGLIALPYYRETNPTLSATARRAIGEAVGDYIGMSQRD